MLSNIWQMLFLIRNVLLQYWTTLTCGTWLIEYLPIAIKLMFLKESSFPTINKYIERHLPLYNFWQKYALILFIPLRTTIVFIQKIKNKNACTLYLSKSNHIVLWHIENSIISSSRKSPLSSDEKNSKS